MHKAWSRGGEYQIRTLPGPELGGNRVLLTVHDAPWWIADEMRKAAERFVAPLEVVVTIRAPASPNTARIRELAQEIVDDDNQIEAAELLILLATLLESAQSKPEGT